MTNYVLCSAGRLFWSRLDFSVLRLILFYIPFKYLTNKNEHKVIDTLRFIAFFVINRSLFLQYIRLFMQ